MADLLLGIDVGSNSTKGALVATDGTVVHEAQVGHTYDVPRPGWAEMDAEAVWWGDTVAVSRELTAAAGPGDRVAAVGISAMGPCVLPVDSAGQPLRPAILYGVDSRATEQIAEIEAEHGRDAIFEVCGNRLTSQSVGPKLRWLREVEPDAYEAAETFLTAPAFIVRRLTGVSAIDRHSASHCTPLVDIGTVAWTRRFADGIVDVARMPPIRSSRTPIGDVTREAAEATGIPPGTPVTVGAADTMAEALSVGVVNTGDLMLMYGSTAFLLLLVPERISHPDLWTTAGAFGGSYGLTGGMATAGAATTWFRDRFAADLVEVERRGGADAYAALAAEAGEAPVGSRGVVFLPYLSGERTPLHDPDARGLFAGLSLRAGRGDLYRAVLEGVAFGMRHNLETMLGTGADVRRVVAIGGGARNPLWLRIVSDVTGLRQHLVERSLGAAYGDAFRAGLAVGLVERADLTRRWVRMADTVEPTDANRSEYDEAYADYRALYRSTVETSHRLAARGIIEDRDR